MPFPSLVVKKGSKRRGITSAGMPGPVSSTASSTSPPSRRVETRTPPCPPMACAALSSRLITICESGPASARASSPGSSAKSTCTWDSSGPARTSFTHVSTTWLTSTGASVAGFGRPRSNSPRTMPSMRCTS